MKAGEGKVKGEEELTGKRLTHNKERIIFND
jgi:hypothetical protein